MSSATPPPSPPASSPGAHEAPRSARPRFPEGYGLPDSTEGLLSWDQVEQRLVAATNYWLVTVRPDGRPHVVPRWGVWVEGLFFYDGAPDTVHARNADANPQVALHLEDGTQSVIVEGTSTATRADPDGRGALISAAFGKYRDLGYSPAPDAWADSQGGGLRVITPRRALAWFNYPSDATRFTWS